MNLVSLKQHPYPDQISRDVVIKTIDTIKNKLRFNFGESYT